MFIHTKKPSRFSYSPFRIPKFFLPPVFKIKPLSKVITILILFSAIGTATYFYYQYKKAVATPNLAETEQITKAISKFMELPNEHPSLVTVTDEMKLKQQPFFQNAQNGDKVLIFQNAKRAILYRPATKKVIDVAPIRTLPPESTATVTPSPEPASTPSASENKEVPEVAGQTILEPVTLVLYNGTEKPGATSKVETLIKEKFPNIQITAKALANKRNYEKTVVVDLINKNSKLAEDLANLLSAAVSTLPPGEVKPESALLIIVAEDQL